MFLEADDFVIGQRALFRSCWRSNVKVTTDKCGEASIGPVMLNA